MRGRIHRAGRWLRLALASMAVAAGAVPAHAQAQASPPADAVLVVAPAGGGQRAAPSASTSRPRRIAVQAEPGSAAFLVREVRPESTDPPVLHASPTVRLFLTHHSLLR